MHGWGLSHRGGFCYMDPLGVAKLHLPMQLPISVGFPSCVSQLQRLFLACQVGTTMHNNTVNFLCIATAP